MNHRYKKIKNEHEERKKEKRPYVPMDNSIKAGAASVDSMVINQLTQTVPKIKEKRKLKKKKKMNIKREGLMGMSSTVLRMTL